MYTWCHARILGKQVISRNKKLTLCFHVSFEKNTLQIPNP